MAKSFRDLLRQAEEQPPVLRRFYLSRERDESGVSGTGIVAVGVQYPSGRCVIEWVSKRTQANSLGVYDNMDDVEAVHGHEGATTIKFYEEEDTETDDGSEKLD